jgi:hypothetical protein
MNNNWISTKEQLPREFEEVLVIDKYGTVAVAKFYSLPKNDGEFECRDEMLSSRFIDILYWQPLPPLPQLPPHPSLEQWKKEKNTPKE